MQPSYWLKTKKKNMEPTQNGNQNQRNFLFHFDQITTSKKTRPIQPYPMTPIPLRLIAQPPIFSKTENSPQYQNRLPNQFTEEAQNDSTFKKVKVSSDTESVSEKFYDPNEMLSLLNQIYKTQEKCGKKDEESQIDQQNQPEDLPEMEDKIQIFSFGPILMDKKMEESSQEKPQIREKLSFINAGLISIIQKTPKEAENIRKQNPLFHLKPSDFDLLYSSDVNYELFFAKKNDCFMRNYVEKKYEPQKQELRNQIKEEVAELMQIKEGKYLTNIILTEVLEELLNLDRFEEQVDEQIQKYEAKLKKSVSKFSNTSSGGNKDDKINDKMIEKNFDIDSMSKKINFDFSSQKFSRKREKIPTYISNSESKDPLPSQIPSLEISPQDLDVSLRQKTSEKILKNLDEQISGLNTRITEKQITLKQEANHQTELQIICKKQQEELEDIENYRKFVYEQLQALTSKSEKSNLIIIEELKQGQSQRSDLSCQISERTLLNHQKLNELLEHMFDVFCIDIQIHSNKLLKHLMEKKKWKINSQVCKNQMEQSIMDQFYETVLKSSLLSTHLQKSNLIHEIIQFAQKFASQKVKPQDLLEFYSKLQKFLKIYLCTKIKERQIIDEKKCKEEQIFVQNLFNLLDTNSYHSQSLKQNFFNFESLFVSYSQKIFNLLFESLNENQSDVQIKKEPSSPLMSRSWKPFGRSSKVSTKRGLTKRKEQQSNHQKYVGVFTSLLQESNISQKNDFSETMNEFIKGMIKAIESQ